MPCFVVEVRSLVTLTVTERSLPTKTWETAQALPISLSDHFTHWRRLRNPKPGGRACETALPGDSKESHQIVEVGARHS